MFYAVLGLVTLGALLAARNTSARHVAREQMLSPHGSNTVVVIYADIATGIFPRVYGEYENLNAASQEIAASEIHGTFQFFDLSNGAHLNTVHK